jgi:hypothetical protein
MLLAGMAPDAVPAPAPAPAPARPGLRKIAPYWYPYTTMAKGRWLDREILEIVSTEFRDRSIEYYVWALFFILLLDGRRSFSAQRYALESGVTTVNGKIAKPDTVVRNGDRIENVVHRHEPPVTSKPVKILHEDREREFIVIDKPGSIVCIPYAYAPFESSLMRARFLCSPSMRQDVIFISLSWRSSSGSLSTRRSTVRTIQLDDVDGG